MADIIDFNQTTRLKRQLEEANAKLAEKDSQLTDALNKLAQMNGVNEMLKLQLADLISILQGQADSLIQIQKNLKNLQGKLPTL